MTTSNSSFNNISPAKTLTDLLAYDDEAFVARVYITLLGRKPDQQGFAYYLERLNKSGDKLGIIHQILKGHEARRYNANVAGLKAAMWRYQWKRMPILGSFVNIFDRHSHKDHLLYGLRKIERRIGMLEANVIAKQSENEKKNVDAAISELFSSFDPQKYLDCNPDVAASGMNPYEHFMRHGWQEGRSLGGSVNAKIEAAVGLSEIRDTRTVSGTNSSQQLRQATYGHLQSSTQPAATASSSKDITSYFMQPADEQLQDGGYTFTQLMHYIWLSRLDLQNAFDIYKRPGRFEFCKWFVRNASNEYGLTPNVYPKNLLEKLVLVGGDVGEKSESILAAQINPIDIAASSSPAKSISTDVAGANLIGYAFGEFGMGEHVRMVARSLNTTDKPFCIIDQDVGLHGAEDASVEHWVTDEPRFDINIFHINADVFPPLYFKFGEPFFTGRYNIGYWAWELSKCPKEFDLALNMVDEVWAISEFVTDSFKTRSSVPVTAMPLAVSVPELDSAHYTKKHYGLPEDKFLFFFTFDAASYLARKNPIAVVRAFKLAFPQGHENVHLLLKAMNIESASPLWVELLKEVNADPRITIMGKKLTREETLGLNLACDVFVSLHRSEGFGRCVAEAMAYGKPVIVTNYSGTRDFAKEGTACVVDYRLVPVPEGAYPFWKDQVWAEPDIEHAASLMRKLIRDAIYRAEIALAGQKYILENFNESVIGERYAKRLGEIWAQRQLCLIQPERVKTRPNSANGLVAYLMQPANEIPHVDGYTFTRLMYYIWISRVDLQDAFNIFDKDGRLEFCKWLLCSAANEYGLTADVYPIDLLEKLISIGGDVGKRAKTMLLAQAGDRNRVLADGAVRHAHTDAAGVNLIGYAFAEFGLGEHVRMMARSFSSTDMNFCIIEQGVEMHGAGDTSVSRWVVDNPQYNTNIFSINADVFPFLYFKLGDAFFSGRYNIGSWAWELSKCPAEFDIAFSMVSEVWSISEFVTESLKTRAPVPVITMPHAVTVPDLDPSHYTKGYYGLPEDEFIFFFTFDSASYLDRKNPVAVVRAFKLAFPNRNENAHLLLKTMNTEVAGNLWLAVLEEINADPRITIMSKKLTREETLGLNLACDAFVSLHRSEGFGFCVAEAMAYGKPVVVTNYSGTRDFAKEGTACLVDYRLVPVPEGAYPFWKDQVWAEPDIEHAASLMKKLIGDATYRAEIALAGQKYILENFNESVIGKRYLKRLDEINAIRSHRLLANDQDAPQTQTPATRIHGFTANTDAPIVVHNRETPTQPDELAGNVDSPTIEQCKEISDAISIEGWVASVQGIECVEIYVDSAFVGQAHYGILRPDIHIAFSHMANASRSGFCYQLDITKLSQGKHTLLVLAKSRSGQIKKWVIDFTLVGSTRYQKWLKRSDELNANKWVRRKTKTNSFFSIFLMVAPEPRRELFEQTLKSLADQIHTKFEIIVLADGSQHQEITGWVEGFGLSGKTRYVANSSNDWMSKLADCLGQFVVLMNLGDVFSPWTLCAVDDVTRNNKEVDLIYGDEDSMCKVDRCKPIFKPGWSPIFLKNFNYIGRPWFVRKNVMASALSALDGLEKDQNEHILLKEIGSISRSVCHIPSVLVSRANYSIDEFEINRASKQTEAGVTQMTYPKVSIVIPTRLSDLKLVDRCFSGLRNLTDYPDFEIIIAINNVKESSSITNYLSQWPFKVIHWNDAFSWSGINNFAAKHATGDYLLFMNDDVEPIRKDWLKIMVHTLSVGGVGAVGPLLKYPNDTIQHLGINFVDYGSGVRHLFRFCSGTEHNLQWLMNYPREVSAVTGACLLTTRECFDDIHGFDENLPLVCNDIDFCIRAREKGYSIVVQPESKLVHHEGVSRAGLPEVEDVQKFWTKWGAVLKAGDPFTNPNLDSTRDDWTVNPSIKTEYKYRITH